VAPAPGALVFGLGGDDQLTSSFDQTILSGGMGGDTLTTSYSIDSTGEPVHALAAQFGNAGDDTLRTDLMVAGSTAPFGTLLNIDVLLDAGSGNDIINARVATGLNFGDTSLRNLIYAGAGDDAVEAVADTTGSIDNSTATNIVHAGRGNDHVSAVATTDPTGLVSSAFNVLTGGYGNDELEAKAVVESNTPDTAANFLSGGNGNDILRAENKTDSNFGAPIGINELQGGHGDDALIASQLTDGENAVTDVTNLLDGGSGDDYLQASSQAFGQTVYALNQLAGGRDNDTLTANVTAGASGGDLEVSNVLDGGAGNDKLEALLSATVLSEGVSAHAENRLTGGAGNDVLVSTVEAGSIGSSFLDGGPGDDELIAIGESNDLLVGGSGADTFRLDVTQFQGIDTIADFEFRSDLLSFTGLADTGVAGLVDDLDAISSFTDSGTELTVVLKSGSEFVFPGLGNSGIESWASIVSDPASQVLIA
jgi:Ca2+-binding RTX toxin-like protein